MSNYVLIFVDTEGANPTPNGWNLREFGAVEFNSRRTFYGKDNSIKTFIDFNAWINSFGKGRKVFISDNPAYDWAPINFYFHKYFNGNPFGHSARRIGDFYAGLVGDFNKASEWKRLRITKHDHNPVNDAMGNVEAFARIIKGERAK